MQSSLVSGLQVTGLLRSFSKSNKIGQVRPVNQIPGPIKLSGISDEASGWAYTTNYDIITIRCVRM